MTVAAACRTPGCERSRSIRDLLCTECWSTVPEPIRRDVLAHHRPYVRQQTAEFLLAFDEAIDAASTPHTDTTERSSS